MADNEEDDQQNHMSLTGSTNNIENHTSGASAAIGGSTSSAELVAPIGRTSNKSISTLARKDKDKAKENRTQKTKSSNWSQNIFNARTIQHENYLLKCYKIEPTRNNNNNNNSTSNNQFHKKIQYFGKTNTIKEEFDAAQSFVIYSGIEQLIAHLSKKLSSYNRDKLLKQSKHANSGDGGVDGDNIDHSGTNDFQSQITCAIKHNGDIFNCINRLFEHIYQLETKNRLQNSSNGGFGGSGGINNLGSGIGINLGSMKQSKSVSVFNHKKISIDNECAIVMNHCWKMLYDFGCYIIYTAWLFVSNINLKNIKSNANTNNNNNYNNSNINNNNNNKSGTVDSSVDFGYGMNTDVLRIFFEEMAATKYGLFKKSGVNNDSGDAAGDKIGYLTSLNDYWQNISQLLFGIFNDGMAKRHVVMQWCLWLSLFLMDSFCLRSFTLPILNDNESDCGREIATEITQFIHILRMFEERYNVNIVPCLLVLQQLKHGYVQYYSLNPSTKNLDYNKLIEHIGNIKKECSNVSMRIICSFLLSLLHSLLSDILCDNNESTNKNKAQLLISSFDQSLNDIIGIEIEEYFNQIVLTNMKSIYINIYKMLNSVLNNDNYIPNLVKINYILMIIDHLLIGRW